VAVTWAVQEWRDRRLKRIAADDPEYESRRATKIISRIGLFIVWSVALASGLCLLVVFLALFFGAISSSLDVVSAAILTGCFAIDGLIYLWADRILRRFSHL
jgi:hypothetical protein